MPGTPSAVEEPSFLTIADINDYLVDDTSPEPHSIAIDSGTEGKLRTEFNASHILWDDPIINPRQSGASHLHQFFGNIHTNAFSTYRKLRQHAQSTSRGGPLNGTGYWQPAMYDLINRVIRKPNSWTIYYNVVPRYLYDRVSANPAVDWDMWRTIWFPRGFRFISGFNHNTNSFPPGYSSPGGYRNFNWYLHQQGDPFGNCIFDPNDVEEGINENDLSIAIPTGDPTLDPGYTGELEVRMDWEVCWDGANLSTANGRDHVRHPLEDGNGLPFAPETHPFMLPGLTLISRWSHFGQTDLENLVLSSDWHPVHRHWHAHGSHFHADWEGAWDDRIIPILMANIHGMYPDSDPVAEGRDTGSGNLGNDKALGPFLGPNEDQAITLAQQVWTDSFMPIPSRFNVTTKGKNAGLGRLRLR